MLPREVCQREGLAENILVSMAIKNGGIQTKFIAPPSEKMQKIGKQILLEDHALFERLK